jgi:high-affinity nickel-transport protein
VPIVATGDRCDAAVMNLFALLGLALVLGMRHAADPDHVVAVTAIATRTRSVRASAWLGIVWGLGHTATLFAVGACIILFNWVVPPRIGLALEFAVAVALVIVGLLNLRHPHAHVSELDAAPGAPPVRRAFAVGLVHGLAGSAAVALLVLATVRDPRWACGYLLVFGLGTLAGMAVVTTSLALPVTRIASRGGARLLRVASGALSLVFGLYLAWQVGWHDGLFAAIPSWTPH